jgi:hypothetical protein
MTPLVDSRIGRRRSSRYVIDSVHRARPIQGVEGHDVVELGGLHLLEGFAHALGLELEHADRVPAREHLVRL